MQPSSAVSPSESLARYLTHKNHYNLKDGHVRWQAFDPPPDLRLSVFRIDGFTAQQIWDNGQKNVAPHIHGMARITASEVTGINLNSVNLEIEAESPPPRHACIIGWPKEKSERKLFTIELAARAGLILRPQN